MERTKEGVRTTLTLLYKIDATLVRQPLIDSMKAASTYAGTDMLLHLIDTIKDGQDHGNIRSRNSGKRVVNE